MAERGLPPRFCHVPFTTLILEPDGTVGSCRMKGTLFTVGDLRTHTLTEIWNGPKLREWRRQFLDDDVRFCDKEVRCNGCHLCPDYNSLLPDVVAREEQTRGPLRLGLNLNGRCNLECKMCHIWQEPNGLYDELGLWPQIEKLVAEVKEIELFSGEPFVQKDTYRLFELVRRTNPECLWTITTNGHWKLTDKIRKALDGIRLKHLTVSMDSLIPEVYARIRRRGRLQVVLDNLTDLIAYDRDRRDRGLDSLNLKVSFTVQRDNWREVASFHDFSVRTGLPVFRAFVYEPKDCSLLTLSEDEREGILRHYFATMSAEQLLHSRRVILPLLDSLPPLRRCENLLLWRERSTGVTAQQIASEQPQA